jgi:hypothetical protein
MGHVSDAGSTGVLGGRRKCRQFAVVDTYKEYMIMMPFQGTTYQREYRLVKPENIKDPIKLVVLNDSLRDSGR